jgi:hypothetical protein
MRGSIAISCVMFAVAVAYWVGVRSSPPAQLRESATASDHSTDRAVPNRWQPRERLLDASPPDEDRKVVALEPPSQEEWLDLRLQVLDDTLEERSRDGWAQETESAVRLRFDDRELGDDVELADVACVEGLCKMGVRFTGEGLLEARQQFEQAMPRTSPFNTRVFMHCPGGWASTSCTAYFTSPEERMPRPERT